MVALNELLLESHPCVVPSYLIQVGPVTCLRRPSSFHFCALGIPEAPHKKFSLLAKRRKDHVERSHGEGEALQTTIEPRPQVVKIFQLTPNQCKPSSWGARICEKGPLDFQPQHIIWNWELPLPCPIWIPDHKTVGDNMVILSHKVLR